MEVTVSAGLLPPEPVVTDSVDGVSVVDPVTIDVEESSVPEVSPELVTELVDDGVTVEESSVLDIGWKKSGYIIIIW